MIPLVCLPVYNEVESIATVIEQIRAIGLDVIVVSGYSTDNGDTIAREMGVEVFYRDGKGKGCAIRKGLDIAHERGYDFLFLIDCDTSYPVGAFKDFMHRGEFDLIMGSRDMQKIERKRRWANRIMTFALNLLFGSSFKDMASGMRALRVEKFRGLLTADNFDIEPQICCVAIRKKFSIAQFDISYNPRIYGSKAHLGDFFQVIGRIITERFIIY